MNYRSSSLFAMLVTLSLLSGCASTATAPASTATEATPTTQAPASETAAPAKSGGGAEPECD